MKIGKLRHRVIIQEKTRVRDEIGQEIDEWVDVKTGIPADVNSISGREFINSSAEQSETTVRIWIRFISGINTGMRIVHNPPTGFGEIYDIKAALPDRKRTRIELLCTHGVNDG